MQLAPRVDLVADARLAKGRRAVQPAPLGPGVAGPLALLHGGAMLVNFAWPRAASNPEPRQTGGLLSFGIGFVDRIPILWTVVVVIMLVGVIYNLAGGRRKQFAPVIAPAGDDEPLVAGAASQPET